ncbi:kinase-like domain-containing protein, partial [Cyathus striatus]
VIAVHFLHQQGVVYRDLKPSNVFIGSDGHVLIGDLGLAHHAFPFLWAYCNPWTLTERCGTAVFAAPEVMRGENYSFGCDFYAIGVMAHLFLSG